MGEGGVAAFNGKLLSKLHKHTIGIPSWGGGDRLGCGMGRLSCCEVGGVTIECIC